MSERQHSIDLMPDNLRARAQAGVRLGQFIAAAVVSTTLTIVAATHSHQVLSGAQEELFARASQAEQVFATEARAAELRHELDALRAYTAQYQRLALPLNVGDVIATVVNLLPESVTLDQLDVDAGSRMINLGPRSRGAPAATALRADSLPPRVLTAELSGFAASDQQIAELVSRLESTAPFQQVSLDFTRSRRVHDKDAREFRVSFRVDMDRRYRVTHVPSDHASAPASAQAGVQESPDAND